MEQGYKNVEGQRGIKWEGFNRCGIEGYRRESIPHPPPPPHRWPSNQFCNINVAARPHTCEPGYFLCGTGHCLDERRHCDGRNDCPDSSDETDCRKYNTACQDSRDKENLQSDWLRSDE